MLNPLSVTCYHGDQLPLYCSLFPWFDIRGKLFATISAIRSNNINSEEKENGHFHENICTFATTSASRSNNIRLSKKRKIKTMRSSLLDSGHDEQN